MSGQSDAGEARPPMVEGDLYLFAHETGAITSTRCHETDTFLTFAETRRAVVDTLRSGGTVWITVHTQPIAIDTLNALRGPGIELEVFQPPPGAPLPGGVHAQFPLHLACMNGWVDITRDLLARRSEVGVVDQRGWTALHYAAQNDNPVIVDLLLGAGADPEATTTDGLTPRDVAIRHHSHLTARRLPVEGPPPRRPDRKDPEGAPQSMKFTLDSVVLLYYGIVAKTGALVLFTHLLLPGNVLADDPVPRILLMVICAIFYALCWSWSRIWFGAPRRLEGSVIHFHRPFRIPRTIDLKEATYAAASPSAHMVMSRYGARAQIWTIGLAHPDGLRRTRKQLQRAGLDPAELSEHGDHFVWIDLENARGVELSIAIRDVLRTHGIPVARSFEDTLEKESARFSGYEAPIVRGAAKVRRWLSQRRSK